MRKNDTGEFELVLGNGQLLSGFFIVVLLFGVAFAMGYIVGRNSSPSPKLQAEAAAATAPGDARPQPAPPPQPVQPAAQPSEERPPAEASGDTQPQPTTQPAQEPAPPAPAPDAPATAQEPEPTSGTYWQVTAARPQAAEIFSRTLKEKGFPVTLSGAPNGLVRVLVGPYSDTAALGRAKTQLESAGFNPIIKKQP
jgi:cell division septation protein DedD